MIGNSRSFKTHTRQVGKFRGALSDSYRYEALRLLELSNIPTPTAFHIWATRHMVPLTRHVSQPLSSWKKVVSQMSQAPVNKKIRNFCPSPNAWEACRSSLGRATAMAGYGRLSLEPRRSTAHGELGEFGAVKLWLGKVAQGRGSAWLCHVYWLSLLSSNNSGWFSGKETWLCWLVLSTHNSNSYIMIFCRYIDECCGNF